MIMPQSRDRCPRIETPPSLPQGKECIAIACWDSSFYPKGCPKVGTDALVCPPERKQPKAPTSLLEKREECLTECHKGLKGGQTRASVPTLWHVLLFNLAVPTNKIQPRYTPNQLSLCTQTVMFTPLSIRREDGSEACGEAFYYITCSQRRMSLRLANTINIMSIVIPAYSAQTINFSDGLRRVIIS